LRPPRFPLNSLRIGRFFFLTLDQAPQRSIFPSLFFFLRDGRCRLFFFAQALFPFLGKRMKLFFRSLPSPPDRFLSRQSPFPTWTLPDGKVALASPRLFDSCVFSSFFFFVNVDSNWFSLPWSRSGFLRGLAFRSFFAETPLSLFSAYRLKQALPQRLSPFRFEDGRPPFSGGDTLPRAPSFFWAEQTALF